MEPTTTALVIGSGMCALATAEVLSRHFERVTVIERDEPLALQQQHDALYAARLANKARPGVQQYNQLHAMTSKGLQLYDKLFDGRFTEDLKASGGNFCNSLESGIIHHPDSGVLPWKVHLPAREMIPLCFASRHLFESTTRKLVTANPKVHLLYGTTVANLVFGGGEVAGGAGDKPVDVKTVTGVRLSDGSTLTAQLVVDCSGRGSNLPAWLAAAGYPRPRTTRASADSGYTAWLCKLAPEVEQVLDDNNIQFIVTLAAPPDCVTASLIQRIEGGLCIASLGGNESRYPGTDHEELMRFAKEEVWHPSAGRLLAGSTFLAPVNHSHDLTSTWRHYEDMSLWPDGLLVMGDAICSFNPTYGQGMTVAVQEATELERLLFARAVAAGCGRGATAAAPAGSVEGLAAKQKAAGLASCSAAHIDSCGRADLASESDQLPRPAKPAPASTSGSGGSSTAWLSGLNRDFQQAARPHIKAAWEMSVGTDMRFKGSTINEPYSRGLVERLAVGYMVQLFSLATTDTVVAGTLYRLFAMLDGPEALLHPAILLRYLGHKAVQHMPGPLRQLLKPWGAGGSSNCVGSDGGGDVGRVGGGDRETALVQLMGWGTARAGPG